MSKEAADRLLESLWRAVDYHNKEYDLTGAELIGVMEILKTSIILDCLDTSEDARETDEE